MVRSVKSDSAKSGKSRDELLKEINRLKRRIRQLKHDADKAERANRAKSEFLAMMSHEIRTPLNAIIGFSDMIAVGGLDNIDEDRYRSCIDGMREGGRLLMGIIGDVLDYSKIEVGEYVLEEDEFDATEMMEAAISVLHDRALDAQLTLRSKFPKSAPVLFADRRSLLQVLLNLLSNAIKFTPAGGSITVSAEVDGGGRFVLAVADNGVGIGVDELDSVMIPFRQLRGAPTHGAAGAGLGLPLAKSIVELHGGNIDITSRLGAGTTVTVHLPVSRLVHPRNPGPAS